MVDRRQHPRHTARKGTYVAMLQGSPRMGQLVDVSLGGLSFQYIEHEAPASPAKEAQILIGDDSVYLEELPGIVVDDFPISERYTHDRISSQAHSLRHVRQRRLKFGSLSEDQKAQLAYFIRYRTDKAA